jgi:hypothetical protein
VVCEGVGVGVGVDVGVDAAINKLGATEVPSFVDCPVACSEMYEAAVMCLPTSAATTVYVVVADWEIIVHVPGIKASISFALLFSEIWELHLSHVA